MDGSPNTGSPTATSGPAATTIELNGARHSIRPGATVRELVVDDLRIGGERVAVELNRVLLPRAQWDHVLANGDRIEIVTFVGGG